MRNLSNKGRKIILTLFCVGVISTAGDSSVCAKASESFVSRSNGGMVVAANPEASEAGIKMLENGGNAFDAAVASSFAISVLRPQSTGIGGGGFLLFYRQGIGKAGAIDFRERAPLDAERDMFVRDGRVVASLSRKGGLAVAVPGLVAGLLDVHHRFGNLALAEVMGPAIRLATDGFAVYPHLERAIRYREDMLAASEESKEIYFRGDLPLKVGEFLIQRNLAKTLVAISRYGNDAFYRGRTAEAIVTEIRENGGIVRQTDLETYRVINREPVKGVFEGAEVIGMPPPSSGGVLLVQMLNVLSGFPQMKLGFENPQFTHLLAETLRLGFRDRAYYLGDSDFVSIPVDLLTSSAYAKTQRGQINIANATPSKGIPIQEPAKIESTSTTHISVLDQQGNAVATTQTVNLYFGSGVIVEGTGIMLNDEMDDFNAQPDQPNAFGLIGNSEANAIEASKTPLSSMSPTIVTRDGVVELILGGPGGSRIISSVLQVLVNVLANNMSLPEAMSAARIHHQWYPDVLNVEVNVGTARDDLIKKLSEMGHTIKVSEWGPSKRSRFGNLQAIHVDTRTGTVTGVSDPRGEGEPRGLDANEGG